MVRIRSALSVSFAVSVLAACSVAPTSPEAVSSSAEKLTGGTPSQYPVLQISYPATAGQPAGVCSAVSLSDSWVLTSNTCFPTYPTPAGSTVCDTASSPARCSLVAEVLDRPSTDVYGYMVKLATPIPSNTGPYPTLGRAPLAIGSSFTCVGATGQGPIQGPFSVVTTHPGTPGWLGMEPQPGTSAPELNDVGLACFQGEALVAIQGKTWSIQDVSFLAPWIDGIFCGGNNCGAAVEGDTTISCGSCRIPDVCVFGTCGLHRICRAGTICP